MRTSLDKNYTSFPLDEPDPLSPKERHAWWPALRVQLANPTTGQRTPRFPAVVDSGSPWCIFKADLGRFIGLDVDRGPKYPLGGVIAGVREAMYFHKVKLYVELDWVIEVNAGFAEKLGVTGILGRNGFFTNFLTTFDHSSHPPVLHIEKINKA